MDHLQTEGINRKLTAFAIAAGPSKKYWREGKVAVQKIVERLQQDPGNGGYKIGWMLYGGSVGKRTALRDSDFDVLVFINKMRPPLTDCLIHFEDILKRNKHNLKIEGIAKSPHSIQFKVTSCDINVDLVPAVNFLVKDHLRQRHRIAEQHRRALQALKNETCPEIAFTEYGSSLSAFQRQFMRDQGDFTQQAVRIAKIWLKSLSIGKPSYGVKTMLELVVASCVMEERNEPPSHLSVFYRFLTRVRLIDGVKIEFIERSGWVLNAPKPGTQGYIIDPCNPYDDLLKRTLKSSIFSANLKEAANKTLQRLGSAGPENIIKSMFTPLYLPSGEWTLRGKEIQNEIIEHLLQYSSHNPSMVVQRKPEKLKELDYKMTVEVIKKLLMNSVNALAYSPERPREDPSAVLHNIRRSAYEMIAVQVLERPVNWGPGSRSFDTCDIILTVPVPNASENFNNENQNIGAIFGFSWAI